MELAGFDQPSDLSVMALIPLGVHQLTDNLFCNEGVSMVARNALSGCCFMSSRIAEFCQVAPRKNLEIFIKLYGTTTSMVIIDNLFPRPVKDRTSESRL